MKKLILILLSAILVTACKLIININLPVQNKTDTIIKTQESKWGRWTTVPDYGTLPTISIYGCQPYNPDSSKSIFRFKKLIVDTLFTK